MINEGSFIVYITEKPGRQDVQNASFGLLSPCFYLSKAQSYLEYRD